MPSIADAYVELHVDGDNLEGEVRTSVRKAAPGAERDSDRVGQSIGSRMAAGFLKRFEGKLKSGSLGKTLKDSFKGFNPKGLMIPALAAAIPFVTSAVSALTGTLVAFTGAVAQAGASSLSFVGVLGSLIQAKMVAGLAFKDFTKAVAGDEKALAKMSPAALKVIEATKGLSGEWNKVRRAVQQNVFAGLDKTLTRVGNTVLPVMRSRLAGTGTQLNLLFKDIGKFATSEGFVKRFGNVLQRNNTIFAVLRKAAVPVLDGLLRLFQALQPSGLQLANIILRAGKSFQSWASAPGFAERIGAMMSRAFKSASSLWGILKNLGATLRNVFGAATPAGDGLLKTIERITAKWAELSGSVGGQNAIAKWAEKSIEVTGRLFSFIGKIGAALGPLFNPSVADGYLSVFEKVMPVIVSIVKAVQTALAPVLERVGEAFAENGPKIAGLFKALSPLLAGVGAVIGEVISQSLDMVGTIAKVITPVVGFISGLLGPVMVKFAPIIAAVILAFTNWGSVLVKMIPLFGRFLAPIVRIAEDLLATVAPAFKFLGKIIDDVFRGVKAGMGVFFKFLNGPAKAYWNGFVLTIRLAMLRIRAVIGPVLGFLRAVFTTTFRVIGAVVRTAFNAYRTIIVGAMNVIRGVVTSSWRVITAVVRGAVRGITAVVRGAWNTVKVLTSGAWNLLVGIVQSVWSRIGSVVARGITSVINAIRKLPGQIVRLGTSFLNAGKDIGGSVIDGIQRGLSATGGLLSDIGSKIKSAINGALNLPITLGKGPLKFTIPAFARGGIAPGGPALVGERGAEIVDLPRNSRVHSASETRQMLAPSLPETVILRVGEREFRAWFEDVTDRRVEAANSLARQVGR